MFKVSALSLDYGENKVLDKVNLQGQPGQIHLISGTSGSGKSSLLKAINGIIPEFTQADLTGKIEYMDINIKDVDMASRADYISSVFQNPKNQFFATDTTDEIAFGLENRNLPREEILKRVKKSSELLSTSYLLDRDIFNLSGGEKQLVAITSVLAIDNDIYIFDEPFSSLDTGYIDKLRDILLKLKEMGKIVIIGEHRIYYFIDILDQIHILDSASMATYNMNQFDQKLVDKYKLRTMDKISIRADEKKNIYDKSYNKNADLVFEDFKYRYKNGPVIFGMNLSLEEDINFIIGKNGILYPSNGRKWSKSFNSDP